ncbi:UNVERIFIED_CONTAM: hypothetical protein FKN15_021042 [Acipenser sinensis]
MGGSGSEADDETPLKFYTEHQRGRRRSKGSPRSPVNKNTLTLLAVSSCVLAVVYGSQLPCPLTVKVTLHVPEHFIADGSSFVVSMGSYLDVSDWLNPAKLSLYYQTNSTSPWVRDYCGQRTTAQCEQLCDQETELLMCSKCLWVLTAAKYNSTIVPEWSMQYPYVVALPFVYSNIVE